MFASLPLIRESGGADVKDFVIREPPDRTKKYQGHSNPWTGGAAPSPGGVSEDLMAGGELPLIAACSPVPCIDAPCVTSP
jgi:hypothetical protein